MRDNLQEKSWSHERLLYSSRVQGLIFVRHGRCRDADAFVVECADEPVITDLKLWLGKGLWKTQDLASRYDPGNTVQVHAVVVSARLPVESHRNDLTGLRVRAQTR